MTILGYILMAVAFAFYQWMAYRDRYKASLQEIWTIPAEENDIYDGEDGYYSERKGWTVDIIVTSAGILTAFIIPRIPGLEFLWMVPFASAALFAIWGTYTYFKIEKDWKLFNKTIEGQRVILTNIKRDPDNAKEYLGSAKIIGFGKKSVWKLKTFFDFYSDLGDPKFANMAANAEWFADQARAEAEMIPRIVALAKKPESEWFLEDRAENV